MNTNNNSKVSVFVITTIMVIVVVLAFILFVPVTVTSTIAFLFAILAIAMFCGGKLHMLGHLRAYPWYAAFPLTILIYLFAQFSLSAKFVAWENIAANALSVRLFFFSHVALLAVVVILLILLKGGKNIIEQRDAEVKQRVGSLRLMQSDVESIMRHNPVHAIPLRKVTEAIRYSDPMTNPTIAVYDEEIHRKILALNGMQGNDSANIPQICEDLLLLIADRNTRIRLMK